MDEAETKTAKKRGKETGTHGYSRRHKIVADMKADFANLGAKNKNHRVRQIRYFMELIHIFPNHLRDMSDFQYSHRIGQGGFGNVWVGKDLRTGKVIAIKELPYKELSIQNTKFHCREVATLAKIDSPFVVPFIGYTIEAPVTIVTEYLPNGTLSDFTNRRTRKSRLSGTHKTIIALCIAYGLSDVTKANVLHRDVKVSNIFMDEDMIPRIGDFGVARLNNRMRTMTMGIGTKMYMAPEVVTSDRYDYQVDVWGYGMLLYEMSQGRRPFDTMKTLSDLSEVVEGKRPVILDKRTPKSLVDLMNKCWNAQPEERPNWEQIIEMFQSGEVGFRGSDVKAVQDAIKELLKKRKPSGAPTVPSVNIERVYKRLRHKLMDILETVGPDGEDIEVDHISRSKSFELDTLQKIVEMAKSQEEALKDPSQEKFDNALVYVSDVIGIDQFKPIYEIIVRYFCDDSTDDEVILKCLEAFTRLANREPVFVKAMVTYRFMSLLPLATDALIDASLELVGVLFESAAKYVDQTVKRAVTSFVIKRPDQAVQLLAVYTSKEREVSDCGMIMDIFISYAPLLMDLRAGAVVLDSMYCLIERDWQFYWTRSDVIWPMLQMFMRSKNLSTARRAIDIVSRVFDGRAKIAFDAVASQLTVLRCAVSAVSLCLRIREYPVSDRLCRGIVASTRLTLRSYQVLWKYADQSIDHARGIVHHSDWMSTSCRESFILMLVLMKYPELRHEIIGDYSFYTFLGHLAKLDDTEVLVGVAFLIEACDVDQNFITNLSDASFFANYATSIQNVKHETKISSACNSMLLFLSDRGDTTDYGCFLELLKQQLLSKCELVDSAIMVLMSFILHCSLAKQLMTSGLCEYLESVKCDSRFDQIAELFIKRKAEWCAANPSGEDQDT